MPVRLLQPYEGQAANTLFWSSNTLESTLRGSGLADDQVELASDYERATRIVTAVAAQTSRNAMTYRMRSVSPQVLTISPSGYWASGSSIRAIQEGTGSVSLIGGSGVTLVGTLTTGGINTEIELIKGPGETWTAYASGAGDAASRIAALETGAASIPQAVIDTQAARDQAGVIKSDTQVIKDQVVTQVGIAQAISAGYVFTTAAAGDAATPAGKIFVVLAAPGSAIYGTAYLQNGSGGLNTGKTVADGAAVDAVVVSAGASTDQLKVIASNQREILQDGVYGDFRLTDDNLGTAPSYSDTYARALVADAKTKEVIQDGFFAGGGPNGETLSYTAEGLRATVAPGSIGADVFSEAGKAAVRHALPASLPVNVHDELDGAKYKVVTVDAVGTATDILKSAAANFRWPAPLGSVLSVASDQSDGVEAAVYRAYTASADGKTLLRRASALNPTRRAIIIVIRGESLPRGGQDGLPAPVPGPYNLGTTMMPNGGVHMGVPDTMEDDPDTPLDETIPQQALAANYANLVPLVEPVNKQEFGGPLARRIFLETGIPIVIINGGYSGRKYSQVKKGAATGFAYSNVVNSMTSAVAHLKRHGWNPEIAESFLMGVNDAGSGSSYTFFQPLLSEEYNNFSADARAILNDPTADIRMFYSTPMSVGGSATGSWVPGGIADFQYNLPTVHYVGPLMGIAYFDRNHPASVGYVRGGECLFYRAIKTVLIDKLPWKALRPVKGGAIRTGTTTIVIPLEGNTGVVRILTDTLVPAIANSGIQVWSSAGVERAVSAVTVDAYGGGYALTIAGTAFAANDIITGALVAPGTTNAPADRARTNIADSDPLVGIYDTSTFPKWLGQFREITA